MDETKMDIVLLALGTFLCGAGTIVLGYRIGSRSWRRYYDSLSEIHRKLVDHVVDVRQEWTDARKDLERQLQDHRNFISNLQTPPKRRYNSLEEAVRDKIGLRTEGGKRDEFDSPTGRTRAVPPLQRITPTPLASRYKDVRFGMVPDKEELQEIRRDEATEDYMRMYGPPSHYFQNDPNATQQPPVVEDKKEEDKE